MNTTIELLLIMTLIFFIQSMFIFALNRRLVHIEGILFNNHIFNSGNEFPDADLQDNRARAINPALLPQAWILYLSEGCDACAIATDYVFENFDSHHAYIIVEYGYIKQLDDYRDEENVYVLRGDFPEYQWLSSFSNEKTPFFLNILKGKIVFGGRLDYDTWKMIRAHS